VKWIELA